MNLNSIASLAAGVAVLGMLSVSAIAQDASPLTNASFQGTYSFVYPSVDAEQTVNKSVLLGLAYFDGEGAVRNVSMTYNLPGEADADGNFTRENRLNVRDASTWSYWESTYEVTWGGFTAIYRNSDLVPTRMEMIDGILTIVEGEMFGGGYNSFDRIPVATFHRLSGDNLLPPAP
jgi:hypothetical protein